MGAEDDEQRPSTPSANVLRRASRLGCCRPPADHRAGRPSTAARVGGEQRHGQCRVVGRRRGDGVRNFGSRDRRRVGGPPSTSSRSLRPRLQRVVRRRRLPDGVLAPDASGGDCSTVAAGSASTIRKAGPKNSGTTSSSIQVAPGVTIGSSRAPTASRSGHATSSSGHHEVAPPSGGGHSGVGTSGFTEPATASRWMRRAQRLQRRRSHCWTSGLPDIGPTAAVPAKNDPNSTHLPSANVAETPVNTAASALSGQRSLEKVSTALGASMAPVRLSSNSRRGQPQSDHHTHRAGVQCRYGRQGGAHPGGHRGGDAVRQPGCPGLPKSALASSEFVNEVVTDILNPFLAPARIRRSR